VALNPNLMLTAAPCLHARSKGPFSKGLPSRQAETVAHPTVPIFSSAHRAAQLQVRSERDNTRQRPWLARFRRRSTAPSLMLVSPERG